MTTLVVGVCGASSSGKTWLAAELSAGFAGRSEVISQDGYYRDNAAVQLLDYRHDNPEAIDFDALVADVEALLCNGHEDVPVYDYTVHAVAGTRRLAAPELLIIEGHLLFASAALRALCGYTVWVSAKADLRLERRLRRDIEERGR
ncbi:MAG: uridine kinase, partial [Pseudomonadota bacterium]